MLDNVAFVFCLLGSFVLGYLIGRVNQLSALVTGQTDKPRSFLQTSKSQPVKSAINIDDATYVAPIDTGGLSRTNSPTPIGKTTKTQDDIQTSISKLAQLKGK